LINELMVDMIAATSAASNSPCKPRGKTLLTSIM